MKKIYAKSLFIVCLFIGLTGCSTGLDLSPQDSISDASFWKSSDDYKKAANALYSALPGYSFFDLEADVAFQNPNSISNSTATTPDTDGNWNGAYSQIRNCNNLIAKASESSIAADLKTYVAEAKFFRAFNYWQLYRLFGGVPIVTKVLDINSNELFSSRSSAKETVDFILNDLKEAVSDLPEESQVASTERGHITKGAANGLRARVALFEGTWRRFRNDGEANTYLDIAVEASSAVMNSRQYALFTAYGKDSYQKLFDQEGDNNAECVLDRKYEKQVNVENFAVSIQEQGYLPTKKLADMYLCSDGLPVDKSPLFQGYEKFTSEFNNRDPRMRQTIMLPGTICYAIYFNDEKVAHWPFYPDRVYTTGYIINKYVTQVPEYNGIYSYSQGIDRHLIRYAEVLLIYAEAMYEKNGNISDDDLNKTINIIRQRAGLETPLTNAFVTQNRLNMREEIRRERTIELALEGFRWDDVRRWKTAETELKQAIRGIKIKGTEWGTLPILVGGDDRNPYPKQEWQDRTDADGFIISEPASARSGFDPNKHYLRPLPAKELQLNPALTQNPGW